MHVLCLFRQMRGPRTRAVNLRRLPGERPDLLQEQSWRLCRFGGFIVVRRLTQPKLSTERACSGAQETREIADVKVV